MLSKGRFVFSWVFSSVCFFGASSLSSAAAYRSEPGLYVNSDNCVSCRSWAYVATLSAGPYWSTGNQTTVVNLTPTIQNQYAIIHTNKVKGTGEIFIGLQHLLEKGFNGQAGFAVAIASPPMSGHVWENSNIAFNDSTFKYTMNSVRYAGKGKFSVDTLYGIATYVAGSAGVAVNKANNYSATAPLVNPLAVFNSNTETSFSYTLGVGFEHSFAEHWTGGIGYEFADWGKNALSRASWQTEGHGLGFSHLYTNELQVSITYIV